jgi:hypothetical protein
MEVILPVDAPQDLAVGRGRTRPSSTARQINPGGDAEILKCHSGALRSGEPGIQGFPDLQLHI